MKILSILFILACASAIASADSESQDDFLNGGIAIKITNNVSLTPSDQTAPKEH